MRSFDIRLDISPWDYQQRYGASLAVIARASNGQRVQFPASMLQKFVGRDGVHGDFRVSIDDDCRLREFRRLE